MKATPEHSPPSAAGYASARYAAAFGHDLCSLPACGGHLMLRSIAGTGVRDASGCYPVFSCRRPRDLAEDLMHLPADLATLTLVPDPLQDFDLQALQASFPIVRPLPGFPRTTIQVMLLSGVHPLRVGVIGVASPRLTVGPPIAPSGGPHAGPPVLVLAEGSSGLIARSF